MDRDGFVHNPSQGGECWGECMYAGCVHGVRGERSDVPHSLRSLWYQSGRVLGECSTLKVRAPEADMADMQRIL